MPSTSSAPPRSTSYVWPVSACILFLGCVLLSQPFAETGIVDDWSIFQTAKVLAQTGHMHYNGWEAPILGWPVYVAAAAMRLLGFSYIVARSTIVLESTLLLFIFQRALVRCGISAQRAAFGALCLAVTPPYFANSVLFMTDIPGLLGVVLCWYLCLRALEATTARNVTLWIISACFAGAILGTTRQIAWLGLLVIVPGALWLLRSRGRSWVPGALTWCLGALYVFLAMRWLNHQPYVLPEHLLPHGISAHKSIVPLMRLCIRVSFEVLLLLAPVALSLYSGLRQRHPQARTVAACALVFLLLTVFIGGLSRKQMVLAPYLLLDSHVASLFSTYLSFGSPLQGPAPTLTWAARLLLSVLTFATFAAAWLAWVKRRAEVRSPDVIDDTSLAILTLPFCIAYFILLLPRALTMFTVDRYLLFLLPFAVLWLLRLSARLPQSNISAPAVLCLVIFAVSSVAAMHDVFAIFRANLLALNRASSIGITREQISGGIEYDFITQLQHTRYIAVPGTRLAPGDIAAGMHFAPPSPCATQNIEITPAVQPTYLTATAEAPCQRVTAVQPVPLRTWLPPYGQVVVIDRWKTPQ